jgi:mannobiose 2-epimerase
VAKRVYPLVLWRSILLALGVAAFVSEPLIAAVTTGAAPNSYAQRVEQELRTDILPFWLEHTRDLKRGGFYGSINNDLVVNQEAPRGALLTARILWTYSAAYRRYHDPAHLEMARWAYDDLIARFWDKKEGGLYWSVTAKGAPLDPRKLLYVQAFGIYGLSEYYRATGDRAALTRAIELYRTIHEHGHDATHLGYFEEFSREWKVSQGRGFRSAMASEGQKSQNVHLHLMEALANLYRVWPDPALKKDLREVVDVLFDKVFDASTHHLHLFLGEDWKPESNTISFGHDIEFSWLLTETAELLGDDVLTKRVRLEAVEIARVTLEQGAAPDGAVFAEADPTGITNRYKEWWTEAEATVGFLNAYQLSGDRKYLDASLHTWQFIEDQLVDRRHGEWFIGISSPPKRVAPIKVGFWKCPYHNGRACMELIDRLKDVAAPRDPH